MCAQVCSLGIVSGYVVDGQTERPIEAVTVQWLPEKQVTLTNEKGYFQLPCNCGGKGCLAISCVGYSNRIDTLHIQGDTLLRLTLHPTTVQLNTIVVEELSRPERIGTDASLDDAAIVQRSGESLAAMLDRLAGVSQLQNGTHIAKPVVQGLYGNRLTLLNNGIAQSGQQWGNDHGPAIDPLGATSLRVLQGAASVQYPSANTGSIVLVEPTRIRDARDWLAKGTYTLATNGWGHSTHLAAQHAHNGWGWRLGGTFQRGGDQATPNYWLRNTGQQLATAQLQVEREWTSQLSTQFYASTYNAQLGVMRGSHIGNLTDLAASFQRNVPFFTRPQFSYELEAPRQSVHHHLAKVVVEQQLDASQELTYTIAAQLNDRQEFDIRRGGRSKRPALNLLQQTYDVGVCYVQRWSFATKLKVGLQGRVVDNTNQPGTGILPLIPDYRAWQSGAYGYLVHQWKRSRWELGLRYDYKGEDVATIGQEVPRRIIRYQNHWHAGHAALGWTHRFTKAWRMWSSLSYAIRPPAINELYSQGLHQGVSSYEEGDPNLTPEQLGQGRLGVEARLQPWCALEVVGYGQWYKGYIYLIPQPDPYVTIRGAFPLFRYEQTDARMLGADATLRLQQGSQWLYRATYSFLRGDDLLTGHPLVFVPPNNLQQEATYQTVPNWTLGKIEIRHLSFSLTHQYTWQQEHLLEVQDLLAPPEGYHLLGGSIRLEGQTGRTHWRLWCRVENALNTTYRDYLNRQRYFADALGTQVTLGVHVRLQPSLATTSIDTAQR